VTLLIWGVFTFYMWIPTFRTNLTVWVIFLLLWITFFLVAGADLGMGPGWRTAGGYVGLLTGIAALYGSFAEVTNATWNRVAIPLGSPILKH
jgi:succinate-acetate transporter protein